MRTIEELLGEVPALQALVPEHRDTVAGCARNQVFEPGARIMREGDPADAFYVIREGQVALETNVPGRAREMDVAEGAEVGADAVDCPVCETPAARLTSSTRVPAQPRCSNSSAPTATPRYSNSTDGCCATRSPAMAATSSAPKATRSSSPSRPRPARSAAKPRTADGSWPEPSHPSRRRGSACWPAGSPW